MIEEVFMVTLADTKVYKNFQTAIPKEIRKKFDVDKDTIISWDVENNKPTIEFRKKYNFKDLRGIAKLGYPVDSVELKKELYK